MPVQIHCPQCSQTLRVPDHAVGKSVRCPKCQTVFAAKAPEAAPPAPSEKDPFAFNQPASGGFDFGSALSSAAPGTAPPPNSLFSASTPAHPANDPFAGLGTPPLKQASSDPFADLGPSPPKPANSDPFAGLGTSPGTGNSGPSPSDGFGSSQPYNPYAPPAGPSAAEIGSGLPWESRGASFETFIETTKMIMTDPERTFVIMRQDNEWTKSFTYALAGLAIGSAASLLWQIPWLMLQIAIMGAGGRNAGAAAAGMGMAIVQTIVTVAAVYVASIVSVLLSAVVMHLFLMLVGAANRDIGVTLRVTCWATGAFPWLQIVPFIGPWVMAIWQLVVSVIGLAKAHDTTVGKVLLALLLEFLTFCLLCAIPIIAIVALGFGIALNNGAGGGGFGS